MEKKTTLGSNALIYGLATGVVLIIFSMILNMLEMRESPLGYVGILILGAGMWYGTIQLREKGLGGFISYGKAWQSGTVISIIVAVIMGIFTYIYLGYIDPGSMEKELIKAEEQMMQNPEMTEEQIQIAMEWTRKFMAPPVIAIMAVIGYIIFGMLVALITAAMVKKDNSNVFGEPLDQSK